MLKSLEKYNSDVHVFVLCMDHKTQEILVQLDLSFITCILLSDVESEELLSVKKSRSVAEYCWTLSPWLPWYVLQNNASIDFITYLDADLLFYSSVEPIFEEIGNNSIAIIEHRFSPRLKDYEVNGIFCVEWISFRRDDEGMACLSRWRQQCLEWCYYRLEEDRMGDQKYLDEWPERYPSCHIIKHAGAGIAPWNYEQYKFGIDPNKKISVEGKQLIFYHFHQFQLLDNGRFDRLSTFYTSVCIEPQEIYEVYEKTLNDIYELVCKIDVNFSYGMKSGLLFDVRSWLQNHIPIWVKNTLRIFTR